MHSLREMLPGRAIMFSHTKYYLYCEINGTYWSSLGERLHTNAGERCKLAIKKLVQGASHKI